MIETQNALQTQEMCVLMSDSTEQTLSVSGCVITISAQQAEMCQGDTVGFEITVTGGEKRVNLAHHYQRRRSNLGRGKRNCSRQGTRREQRSKQASLS